MPAEQNERDENPTLAAFGARLDAELPHLATREFVVEHVGNLRSEIKDVQIWTYTKIILVASAAASAVSVLVGMALLWARLVPPP